MSKVLAINGGLPEVKGPIGRFDTIGALEELFATRALRNHPLSGYMAGRLRGGYEVQQLEEEWAGKMGVKHAVACNSATSGLLAAC